MSREYLFGNRERPKHAEVGGAGVRVHALDYLRGLLAVAVMAYHYVVWSGVELGAETVLGRLGVYAVSTFYILSGLSLGLVYRNRMCSVDDVVSFAIKRIFRIFPLFWLSVSLAICLSLARAVITGVDYLPDWWRIFLNYSLLFGFVEPSAYLTTGAWSIGNEMVFYALFPFLLFLARGGRYLFVAMFVMAIGVGAYFAFEVLDRNIPLVKQWDVYINPFNQLLLFVCGMSIAFFPAIPNRRSLVGGVLLVLFGCFAFVATPAVGDKIALVTGIERLLLCFSCISVVFGVYLTGVQIKGVAGTILSFLGEGCYSIYLLHPIVGSAIVGIGVRLGVDAPIGYLVSVPTSLLAAWITFRWLERPMMAIGAKVSRYRCMAPCAPAVPEAATKSVKNSHFP